MSNGAVWVGQISAKLTVDGSGNVQFKEDDSYSLNLAPITVQLPGGERVPFMFTVKVPGTEIFTQNA